MLTAFIKGSVRPQGVRLVTPCIARRCVYQFPVGESSQGFHCCLAWLPLAYSSLYHSLSWRSALFPPFGGDMVAEFQPMPKLDQVPVRGLYQTRWVRGELESDHSSEAGVLAP